MSGASDQHRNRLGYNRLESDKSGIGIASESKSKSLTSLPDRIFQTAKRRLTPEVAKVAQKPCQQMLPAKKLGKSHPLFNILDVRRSKKAMAKPEFLRYMEYIKEGGTWAPDSNNPVIHFN